jgi:hypothetical protein
VHELAVGELPASDAEWCELLEVGASANAARVRPIDRPRIAPGANEVADDGYRGDREVRARSFSFCGREIRERTRESPRRSLPVCPEPRTERVAVAATQREHPSLHPSIPPDSAAIQKLRLPDLSRTSPEGMLAAGSVPHRRCVVDTEDRLAKGGLPVILSRSPTTLSSLASLLRNDLRPSSRPTPIGIRDLKL